MWWSCKDDDVIVSDKLIIRSIQSYKSPFFLTSSLNKSTWPHSKYLLSLFIAESWCHNCSRVVQTWAFTRLGGPVMKMKENEDQRIINKYKEHFIYLDETLELLIRF